MEAAPLFVSDRQKETIEKLCRELEKEVPLVTLAEKDDGSDLKPAADLITSLIAEAREKRARLTDARSGEAASPGKVC